MKLIWKLLRQHISIPQLAGFFIANVVGLTIILIGIQFYYDINAVYNSEDSLMKENYIIVNKRVGTLATITGNDNTFKQSEIQDIEEQPFVKKIGLFTPSAFKVSAGFNIDNMIRFSTDMFFESVPDEFVDVEKEKWNFDINSDLLPIVIPKSYLDLYNFGFAQSQNMPKLSEGLLEAMNIDIVIKHDGSQTLYKGFIAGFSNRLNTILVPEEFMKYANNAFASDNKVDVSRIIMVVDNPTDDRINAFLNDNNYETDEDKLDASKTNYILKILLTVVLVVGAVICLLALFILLLSIYLLVEKNINKLENLILIGFSTGKIALPYQLLTILLNMIVCIIALLLVMVLRRYYLNMFESFFPDMEVPSMSWTICIAVGISVLMSFINVFVIKRKVVAIWNK